MPQSIPRMDFCFACTVSKHGKKISKGKSELVFKYYLKKSYLLLNLGCDVIANNNTFYAISIPQDTMSPVPKNLISEALKKGICHTYQ